MLSQNVEAFGNNARSMTLLVRQQEMTYLTTCMATVASSSAMFGGFTYNKLTIPISDGVDAFTAFVYYGLTGFVFAAYMVNNVTSTFCNVYGPGLALRGPGDTSMDDAISGMEEQSERHFVLYRVNFVAFFLAGMVNVFMTFTGDDAWQSWLICSILTGALAVFLWANFAIPRMFYNPKHLQVSTVGQMKVQFGGPNSGVEMQPMAKRSILQFWKQTAAQTHGGYGLNRDDPYGPAPNPQSYPYYGGGSSSSSSSSAPARTYQYYQSGPEGSVADGRPKGPRDTSNDCTIS